MKINIEELHKLLEWRNKVGEYNLPKNCGKTLLKCHELAGSIEVGKLNTMVICIPYYHALNFLIPVLKGVLDEHHLKYTYKQQDRIILCNNKKIIFVLEDDLDLKTEWLGDYYYQYME
jgi:hypothetical protein